MDRLDQRQPYWRRDEDDEAGETIEFQARYASFSDRVERFLTHLVILGLVALALVQTLHTNTTARRMLNVVEALEGIPWNQVTGWTGERPETTLPSTAAAEPLMLTVVSITRKSAPEVRLLLDGKPVGSFAAGSLTVPVRPGQIITVDGRQSAQPLTFRVVGSPELSTPALGASVTTKSDTQTLGAVQVGR